MATIISKAKAMLVPVVALMIGATAGGGWMFYLCKTGPQQLWVDSLNNGTAEAIIGLSLLHEQRYDDLRLVMEGRIAMSGTSAKIFKHPSFSSTERMLRGYYFFLAKKDPPPAIAAILEGSPNVTSDPRSIADAMVDGSKQVLSRSLFPTE